MTRARTDRKGDDAPAETLDPKALAAAAGRAGFADFGRFRNEFFARGGAFRDPSGPMLDLLRRLQTVDNTRRHAAFHEHLSKLFQVLARPDQPGQTPPQLDRVEDTLQASRLAVGEELRGYRDALERFEESLGLSPHAPVAVDRTSVAAFRRVLEGADRWAGDPNRDFGQLARLADRLPTPGGCPIVATAARSPEALEEVLRSAARRALANRGGGPPAERAVRSDVRRLIDETGAYEAERRRFVRALRQRDQAFEQLIAPPQLAEREAAAGRDGDRLSGLLDAQTRLLDVENRLVALWADHQARCVALDGRLGTTPYDDWKSFLARFPARPGAADAGPEEAPAPPPPARATKG